MTWFLTFTVRSRSKDRFWRSHLYSESRVCPWFGDDVSDSVTPSDCLIRLCLQRSFISGLLVHMEGNITGHPLIPLPSACLHLSVALMMKVTKSVRITTDIKTSRMSETLKIYLSYKLNLREVITVRFNQVKPTHFFQNSSLTWNTFQIESMEINSERCSLGQKVFLPWMCLMLSWLICSVNSFSSMVSVRGTDKEKRLLKFFILFMVL